MQFCEPLELVRDHLASQVQTLISSHRLSLYITNVHSPLCKQLFVSRQMIQESPWLPPYE